MSKTGQTGRYGKHLESLKHQSNSYSFNKLMIHKRGGKGDGVHQKFGKGGTSQKTAVETDKKLFCLQLWVWEPKRFPATQA